VEGETEEFVVAEALELFGLRVGLDGVELARLRGIGNDVGVLARYAGAPRLGEEVRDRVLLRRPLPHLAVIADPEDRYRTPEGRAKVKAMLVQELVESVPVRYRTAPLVDTCRRSRNPAVVGVGVQVIPHLGVQVFPQWRGADERRGVHQFGSQHL